MSRMKRKILLSPLVIVILIIIFGVTAAGAAVLLGGGGNTENVNLQKGLVGQWKMDGNAKDSTPNSNHGTVTGATLTTDRKGQTNKAYSFNGTSDDVSVPYSASLAATKITVEVWVKKSAAASGVMASMKKVVGGVSNDGWLFMIMQNNQLRLQLENTPNLLEKDVTYNFAFGDGNWHQVVFTYDGSDLRIYGDTVQIGTSAWGYAITYNTTEPLTIGQDGGGSYFNGLIDEVRIYNRALSATEITALYESYDPGIVMSDLQKGLVGQWKMDGNAKDSTPNSNHGTVTGATLTTDRKGQTNKAYSFNGTSDDVSVPYSASLAATNITVEVWVKKSAAASGVMASMKKVLGTDYDGWLFMIMNNNQIRLQLENNPNDSEKDVVYNFAFGDGNWHQAVFTYDGSNLIVYGDAVQIGTSAWGYAITYNTTEPLTMGQDGGGSYFNGLMDEVRIYNRALSATEITALYESYDPGIVMSDLQKGLVGQWKMDGNAKDSTPNSNHGTVTGATLTTDRKGQTNKAYSFNGTSDYVDVSDPADGSLDFTSSFSIATWIKPASVTPTWQAVVDKRTSYGVGYMLELQGNDAAFGVNGPSLNVPDVFSVNNWYHFVGVFDDVNNKEIIYINGVRYEGTQTGAPSANTANLRIGRVSYSAVDFFQGLIDEVRIYNRVLTATEITALYESY